MTGSERTIFSTGDKAQGVSVKPPRLDALTSLRFFAAAMIVVVHGFLVFGLDLGAAGPYALGSGVSFFFVLSGFILGYNYPALADPEARKDFWMARFARVWPQHVLALVVTLIVVGQSGWFQPGIAPWSAGLLTTLLLQAWIPIGGYVTALNGPAWTLSVEAFFYACFPLLLVALRRNTPLTLVAVATVSIAGPLFANCFGSTVSPVPLDHVNWFFLDHMFPPARLLEFAMGMAAAKWWISPRARPSTGGIAATVFEVAAIALLLGGMLGVHRMPYAGPVLGSGVADWLTQVCLAPLYLLVILSFAGGGGCLARLLSKPIWVRAGELSFAIYLLHPAVLIIVYRWRVHNGWGSPATTIVFIAMMTLVAWLAWRLVEMPARSAIIGAWRRHRAATP